MKIKSSEKIAAALVVASALYTSSEPVIPAPSIIDVSILPDTLPPPVKAVEASAVKLYLDAYAKHGDYASGARISEHTVLTTGHLFSEPTHCNGIVVDIPAPGKYKVSDAARGIRFLTNKAQKHTGIIDAAVVTLPDNPYNDSELADAGAPVVIRDVEAEPVKKNEPVFIFGYGQYPFANGESHQRDAHGNFGPEQIQKGYASPHIIGGIVVQAEGRNGAKAERYAVATGLEDYTAGEKDPEKRTHSGDSGGMAVDRLGRIIGVVANANWEISQRGIKRTYGGVLTNLPPHYNPSLALLQPVDTAVVASLQQLPAEPCTPVPE